MQRINSNVVQLNVIEEHLVQLRDHELADGHNIIEASLRALRTTTGRTVSNEFARYLSDGTVFMIYNRPELTAKGKSLLDSVNNTDSNN